MDTNESSGGPGVGTFFETQEEARLDTICGGHIPEMFQREFLQALANAMDPNTPFKKKREVKLTVTIETDEERDSFRLTATTSSKLAPFLGEGGTVFAARRGASVVAVTYRADQLRLPYDSPKVVPGAVPAASQETRRRKAE